MSLGVPRWVAPYIGLPFRAGGRDGKGVDCWGLVRLPFLVLKGITLPLHDAVSADDMLACADAIGEGIVTGPWCPVDDGPRRDLDVIVMRGFDRVRGRMVRTLCHVGLAVGPARVLHIDVGQSSVCVSTAHDSVRHRIASTYRHADLQ